MDQDTFLSRVRESLGRGKTLAPAEPPPAFDESIARLVRHDQDVVTHFASMASSLGMKVYRMPAGDAGPRLEALLRELNVKTAAVGFARLPQGDAMLGAVRRAGVAVIDHSPPRGFDAQYDVDCGITDAVAALAESGTLIVESGPRQSRGLSLLPPIHIALLPAALILPDMIDYWRTQQGKPALDLPSSIAFISGPSKTADIEGELIVGVHGPGQVHVMILE
jgi:L-lactate dehydrogenase complex protein LldG